MKVLIDADKLLAMTDSYKNELGRLKADPFVKSGIETVEGFINDLPTVQAVSVDKVKQARKDIENLETQIQSYHNDDPMISQADVLSILDKLIESGVEET